MAHGLARSSLSWLTVAGSTGAIIGATPHANIMCDEERQVGAQAPGFLLELLLERATDIMDEVFTICGEEEITDCVFAAMICGAHDEVNDADDVVRLLRGSPLLVEFRATAAAEAESRKADVRAAMLVRRQQLERLCRGASAHAATVMDTRSVLACPEGGAHSNKRSGSAGTRSRSHHVKDSNGDNAWTRS